MLKTWKATHELGHQSHWKLASWNLMWGKKIVRESWADFIEHTFIRVYYPGIKSDRQDKNRDDMSDGYSANFIDLVDDNNQRDNNKGDTDFPDDSVKGYSIHQLQQAVKKSRKLEHIRNYLRDHYANGTENQLDELFDFYIEIQ